MIYKLQYLPLAKDDLDEIILYISDILNSPKAALNLLDDIEKNIKTLIKFPFAFPVYDKLSDLQYEYRMIPVKNYAVFYIVENNIVEIHRIVYAKMDFSKLL
ncbi:MAG: type II toxin-antitoxin system RelE/ParE family toxin [Clostridia bacterium]